MNLYYPRFYITPHYWSLLEIKWHKSITISKQTRGEPGYRRQWEGASRSPGRPLILKYQPLCVCSVSGSPSLAWSVAGLVALLQASVCQVSQGAGLGRVLVLEQLRDGERFIFLPRPGSWWSPHARHWSQPSAWTSPCPQPSWCWFLSDSGTQVITRLLDSTIISHLLQRSDGVRNVPQLHVKVPGIVQQCPEDEDGRIGEVNVKLWCMSNS